MIDEDIVTARIVNTQTMEFQDWCEHLADGSTVTAADVSAVMKQIEKRLPTILGFNTKVICSPEGLTFRPKVSGSITQSELKAKLTAKKAAETDPAKAALIDVNRPLNTSDLSISDCTLSIIVDLPKEWSATFMQKAKLKRVTKVSNEVEEPENTDEPTNGTSPNPSQGGGSVNQGGGSQNSGGQPGGGNAGDNEPIAEPNGD